MRTHNARALTVEDGRASNEHVDTRLRDLLDVGDAHTAIDLERDVIACEGDGSQCSGSQKQWQTGQCQPA